jgi:hypothetical protein
MEDVLEVYHRPHDPQRPVVCLDECSKQLIGEVRTPVPPRPAQDDRPGRAERYDCEYVRNGTANLFMAFEPLGGWRAVAVTDQRRRIDWARFVRDLVDGRYREADKIVLVLCQPCSDAFRADLLPRGLAVGGGGGEAVPGDADGRGA